MRERERDIFGWLHSAKIRYINNAQGRVVLILQMPIPSSLYPSLLVRLIARSDLVYCPMLFLAQCLPLSIYLYLPPTHQPAPRLSSASYLSLM